MFLLLDLHHLLDFTPQSSPCEAPDTVNVDPGNDSVGDCRSGQGSWLPSMNGDEEFFDAVTGEHRERVHHSLVHGARSPHPGLRPTLQIEDGQESMFPGLTLRSGEKAQL